MLLTEQYREFLKFYNFSTFSSVKYLLLPTVKKTQDIFLEVYSIHMEDCSICEIRFDMV